MSQSAKHHYLIAGELVFKSPEMETVNGMRANGILLTDETNLGIAAIGKAQQVLQANFFQKMQDPTLIIIDVIITGLIYIGFMTEEEFKRTPPGMVQQEKAPEVATPSAANDTPVVDPLAPGQVDPLQAAISEAGDSGGSAD